MERTSSLGNFAPVQRTKAGVGASRAPEKADYIRTNQYLSHAFSANS
jgi:hypothetical protein